MQLLLPNLLRTIESTWDGKLRFYGSPMEPADLSSCYFQTAPLAMDAMITWSNGAIYKRLAGITLL